MSLRRKTLTVLWPESFIATVSLIPFRTIWRIAERRRS